MVKITGRDVAFWQKVIIIMVLVAVLILFFFLPILAIPLSDSTGGGAETVLKQSIFEHLLSSDFNLGLEITP